MCEALGSTTCQKEGRKEREREREREREKASKQERERKMEGGRHRKTIKNKTMHFRI
jgi:hypothetical protein